VRAAVNWTELSRDRDPVTGAVRVVVWGSDRDYRIVGQRLKGERRAWTEYSCWAQKGTQDVSGIEAQTIDALERQGAHPGQELQMMRDGRAQIGFVFDTADEARAACERHAAEAGPQQEGLF